MLKSNANQPCAQQLKLLDKLLRAVEGHVALTERLANIAGTNHREAFQNEVQQYVQAKQRCLTLRAELTHHQIEHGC